MDLWPSSASRSASPTTLVVAVVLVLAPHPLAEAQSDDSGKVVGEAVLEAQITYTGHGSLKVSGKKGGGGGGEDSLTVKFSGGSRAKCIQDPGDAVCHFEYPPRRSSNVVVTGGGNFSASTEGARYSDAWDYRSTEVPIEERPQASFDVSFQGGQWNVTLPDYNRLRPEKVDKGATSSGDPTGMVVSGLAMFQMMVPRAEFAFSHLQLQSEGLFGGKKLEDRRKGTFDPKAKRFQHTDTITYEYSTPWPQQAVKAKPDEPNWSGNLEGTLTVSFTLSFGASPEVDAEIDPVPKSWKPEGPPPSRDAETLPDGAKGNEITLHMRVKQPGLKGDWTIEVDPSQEPGIAGNSINQDGDPDFAILRSNNDTAVLNLPQDLRAKPMKVTTVKAVEKVDLTLTSMDYAAWAKVRAEVTVEGHPPIHAHLRDSPGVEFVTVPLDGSGGAAENHIADGWEESVGLTGADPAADEDANPPGDGTGDGFSVFEEYRGFFVRENGKLVHRRLDPRVKDLFVRNDTEDPRVEKGIDGFERGSQIKVWRVDKDHVKDDMLVNRSQLSSDRRVGDQHAVLLKWFAFTGKYADITLAEAMSKEGEFHLPTSPGDVESVHVNGLCKDPRSVCDLVWAITHELAHCLHVDHHGGGKPALKDPPGDYDIEILNVAHGCGSPKEKGPFRVAAQGGTESGEMTCPMRYHVADYYESCVLPAGSTARLPAGALPRFAPDGTTHCWAIDGKFPDGTGDANIVLAPVPKAVPQTAFCTSPAGTGYAGNAAQGFGNCVSHMHLSDSKTAAATSKPGRNPLPPACR